MEFAIAAPVFLGFVFVILIGGWLFHGATSVRHALEIASRQLIITPTMSENELSDVIQERIAYLGEPVKLSLSYDEPQDGIVIARAQASYAFTVVLPLLKGFSFSYSSSIAVPLPSTT